MLPYIKLVLLTIAVLSIFSCGGEIQKITSAGSSTRDPSELPPVNAIAISNLSVSNITKISYDLNISFSGDNNLNSMISLYYCNETDSPGCIPDILVGTLNRGSGVFSLSVSNLASPNDPGDTLTIKVEANDIDGVTSTSLISNIILLTNSIPVISPNAVTGNIIDSEYSDGSDIFNRRNYSINENETGTIVLFVTDADGYDFEDPNFSCTGINAPFDPISSSMDYVNEKITLNLNPDYSDAGIYDIYCSASDGEDSSSFYIRISVANVNRVPVLSPDSVTGDVLDSGMNDGSSSANRRVYTINENETGTVVLSVTDADGYNFNSPNFSCTDIEAIYPIMAGMNYVNEKITLTLNPDYSDAGTYDIYCSASDGEDSSSFYICISVANVNRAPVLSFSTTTGDIVNTSIGDGSSSVSRQEFTINTNENGTIVLSANDADLYNFIASNFSCSGYPSFVTPTMDYDSETITLLVEPISTSIETYTFDCSATDGTYTDTYYISLKVNPARPDYLQTHLFVNNPLSNSLVAGWVFNEPFDALEFQNLYSSGNNGFSTILFTKYDTGVQTTGDDLSTIEVERYHDIDNLSEYTIVIGFRPDTLTNSGNDTNITLLSKDQQFHLSFNNSGALEFQHITDAVYPEVNSNVNISSSTYYNVAIVKYKTGTIAPSMWLNGINVSTGTVIGSGNEQDDALNDLFIGSTSNTSFGNYAGIFSYVYIFNRTLSAAEITSLNTDPYKIVSDATRIFRSVGPQNFAALATGGLGNSLDISNNVATFASAQALNIGVGDVIQYDSDNNDGMVDSLAFIHERISATEFIVRSEAGGNATQTSGADENWSIYRAYRSLNDADNHSINTGIMIPFDIGASKNISKDTGTNQQWNIACYNDATDGHSVFIYDWTTSKKNFLKIFTPHLSSEVGVSQRHTGVLGTGYRLDNDSTITISSSYVHIDGISIEVSTGVRAFNIYDMAGVLEGEILISNSFGYASHTGYQPVFSVYNTGALIVKLWNNIGIINSTNAEAAAFAFNDSDATIYAYNNTGIAVNQGAGFYKWNAAGAILKNNIGYSENGMAFSGFPNMLDYCASNDTSLILNGTNIQSVEFNFADEASYDYHLSPQNEILRGAGTNLLSDEILSFSKDISGMARDAASWDIGAANVGAAIYRSVGPSNVSAIVDSSIGGLFTLLNSHAAFSIVIDLNIGVGDALYYDTNGDGVKDAIAFIHERINDNEFILKNSTGGTPLQSLTTNITVWGIYRAYISLSNAEAGIENTGLGGITFDSWSEGRNLVSNNEQWNIACYADGAEVITSEISIDGWVTSDSNYLKIYTPHIFSEVGSSQRHSGVWNPDAYRITREASADNQNLINIRVANVHIDGLQLEIEKNGYLTISGIKVGDFAGTGFFTLSNTLLTSTDGADYALNLDNANLTFNIWNNIIYEWVYGVYLPGEFTESSTIYNNTLVNNNYGLSDLSGVSYSLINNLCRNAGVDTICYFGFSGGVNHSTNISNDTSSPDIAFKSITINFANIAGNDFHLNSSDTAAINQGTLLLDYFSDDIDGAPRDSMYDIGADEW